MLLHLVAPVSRHHDRLTGRHGTCPRTPSRTKGRNRKKVCGVGDENAVNRPTRVLVLGTRVCVHMPFVWKNIAVGCRHCDTFCVCTSLIGILSLSLCVFQAVSRWNSMGVNGKQWRMETQQKICSKQCLKMGQFGVHST